MFGSNSALNSKIWSNFSFVLFQRKTKPQRDKKLHILKNLFAGYIL